MPAVIIGCFLTGCLLITQGLHVLKTGQPPGFGMRDDSPRESTKMSLLSRVGTAALFLAPGIALLLLLGSSFLHSNKSVLMDWISQHLKLLLGSLAVLLFGLFALFRAGVIARSLKRSNPQLYRDEDDKSLLLVVRIVGWLTACFGFYMLAHF